MGLLTGIRVLDVTRNISGPYCTMMLGDLGAEVIKIENPGGGDELRSLFRYPGRSPSDEDYFYMFNRNKKSVVLNLKDERGRNVIADLIATSDVIVENLSPGVADRLGFGWESASRINGNVIYAALSGFGKQLGVAGGQRKAYDGVVQAASGVMASNRCEDGAPRRVSVPLGDLVAGMYAAFGIASALFHRSAEGGGEYLDVSMFDSLLSLQGPAAVEWLITGGVAPNLGNQVSHRVPQNVYVARDGRYVFLTTNERSWVGVCRALDMAPLLVDPRFTTNQDRVSNRVDLDQLISSRVAEDSADTVVKRLLDHEVPSSVVQDLGEALQSNLASDREMIMWIDHPHSGKIPLLGFPYKMANNPCSVSLAPPRLGADTVEILRNSLGYESSHIRDLISTNSVGASVQDSDALE